MIVPPPTNEEEFLAQKEYRLKTFWNCGIYWITNTINNHRYIGSSANISQRFSQHRYDLRHNRHRNHHLQNAWNKYGEENFEFQIIEHWSYPEKILSRENKNIQIYKPEYNHIQVNREGLFFHSDETKRKIGIKSKEKFIKNPELRKASSDRLKNRTPWNKGKTGIYSEETRKKMSESRRGKCSIVLTPEIIEKIVEKTRNPILQYDLEGNFVKEWESIASAARFYSNGNSGNFSTAIKKGIKLYNSYWKRKNGNK